jgi:hypothetical protein
MSHIRQESSTATSFNNIVRIAKGEPPHFFDISEETSSNRGHISPEPNILLANKLLELAVVRGFIS